MAIEEIVLDEKIIIENEEIVARYIKSINELINRYTSLELIDMVCEMDRIAFNRDAEKFNDFIQTLPEGYMFFCFLNMSGGNFDIDEIENYLRKYIKNIFFNDMQRDIFFRNISILRFGITNIRSRELSIEEMRERLLLMLGVVPSIDKYKNLKLT